MNSNDNPKSSGESVASMKDNTRVSDSPGVEPMSAESIVKDSQTLSYDELLHRLETLLQRAEKLPSGEQRHVAEGLLAGAEELLLRQDETGTDFTIAIIALNEHANRQLLAVFRKSE